MFWESARKLSLRLPFVDKVFEVTSLNEVFNVLVQLKAIFIAISNIFVILIEL